GIHHVGRNAGLRADRVDRVFANLVRESSAKRAAGRGKPAGGADYSATGADRAAIHGQARGRVAERSTATAADRTAGRVAFAASADWRTAKERRAAATEEKARSERVGARHRAKVPIRSVEGSRH